MVGSSGSRLGRTIGVDQAVNLQGPASDSTNVITVQAFLPLTNGRGRIVAKPGSRRTAQQSRSLEHGPDLKQVLGPVGNRTDNAAIC